MVELGSCRRDNATHVRVGMCEDWQPMPKQVWVFVRPDGHFEVRREKPDVPAVEYTSSGEVKP